MKIKSRVAYYQDRWKEMISLIEKEISPRLKPNSGAKDPMDWSLSDSSTQWLTRTYCPYCKADTSFNEVFAKICNSCGSFGNMGKFRSFRNIYDGEKWVTQYRYGNGENDYELSNLKDDVKNEYIY